MRNDREPCQRTPFERTIDQIGVVVTNKCYKGTTKKNVSRKFLQGSLSKIVNYCIAKNFRWTKISPSTATFVLQKYLVE